MKKKMNLTAIIAVAMVAMSVFVLGSCNADDGYNEFDYGTLAKGLATRSGLEGEPPSEDDPYIQWSNCGLWSIGYVMKGNPNNPFAHSKVIAAASRTISWDEDANLDSLSSGKQVRGIRPSEMLAVCNSLIEESKNSTGFESFSTKNVPNTCISSPSEAQSKVTELLDNNKNCYNAIVEVTYLNEKHEVCYHWVALSSISNGGTSIEVRDNYNQNEGQNYANSYSIDSVVAILYRE